MVEITTATANATPNKSFAVLGQAAKGLRGVRKSVANVALAFDAAWSRQE
jgi:hypothetical protein